MEESISKRTREEMTFAKLSAEADRGSRIMVAKRDGMRCMKCNREGVQIHEIVPRSSFGRKSLHICFHPKNRCCLCPPCHERAHTNKRRRELLKIMHQRHGYKYKEKQFKKYITWKEDEGD